MSHNNASLNKYVMATMVVVIVAVAIMGAYVSYEISNINRNINSIRDSLAKVNQSLSAQVTARLTNLSERLGLAIYNLNSSLSNEVSSIKSEFSELESSVRYPLMLVDALNQTVYIPSRPVRIVTLDPAATEIVIALNATSQLVGVDNNSVTYLPPPFNYTVAKLVSSGKLSVIGSTYSSPDIEQILSLNPDLVIGTAGWGYNNYIASVLQQYGIPVLLLPSYQSLSDVYKSIIMVGEATGHVNASVSLVESMASEIDHVRELVSGLAPVNVSIVLWINPTYVTGGGTFQNNMIELAGGVNVFENATGWPTVTAEELLQANPQVIIIMSNGGLFNTTYFVQWLSLSIGPAYKDIAAIRYGRVYVIEGWYESVLSEPAVMTPLGVELLSMILYPSAYNITSLPAVISPSTLPVQGVSG